MNRKSLKDQMRENAQVLNFYAKLSDKPLIDVPAGSVKRGPQVRRTDGPKRESVVQQEIIDYLLDNEHVAMVERVNSGAMQEGDRYIAFNTVMIPKRLRPVGSLLRVRKPDLFVLLTDSRPFIIEVKKEGWRISLADIREQEQNNYLSHTRRFGAIAIFATSVEDVKTAMVAHGYS